MKGRERVLIREITEHQLQRNDHLTIRTACELCKAQTIVQFGDLRSSFEVLEALNRLERCSDSEIINMKFWI